MTDFFPLLDEDAITALEAPNPKLEFLKGFLRNSKLAELVAALEEEQTKADKFAVLSSGIHNKYYLLKNAYEADMAWVVGELKAVLAHWGDTESPQLNPSVQQRLEGLVTKLTSRGKIKEI